MDKEVRKGSVHRAGFQRTSRADDQGFKMGKRGGVCRSVSKPGSLGQKEGSWELSFKRACSQATEGSTCRRREELDWQWTEL